MTAGVAAVFVTLIVILILFSDLVTSYIPFSVEKKFAPDILRESSTKGPLPDYLNKLTAKIVAAEELPTEMTITVHYLDDDTVNAFATIGGHVFVFRGLLEKLPNENALAMLLAHEIAHIKHRHPIRSLGRGVIISLALSLLGSESSESINAGFLGEAGFLTIMKYSRDMETEADKTAIAALLVNYGHLAGAADLFKTLKIQDDDLEMPEFFSTHPLSEERLASIDDYMQTIAVENKGSNKITLLPKLFKTWLKNDSE
ncbi:MAG: M48 family metallopeptidase [Thiohalomonadales bacterium]